MDFTILPTVIQDDDGVKLWSSTAVYIIPIEQSQWNLLKNTTLEYDRIKYTTVLLGPRY